MPLAFVIDAVPTVVAVVVSRNVTVKPTAPALVTVAVRLRWSRSVRVVAFAVRVIGTKMFPLVTIIGPVGVLVCRM